ncbi:hypothetical protein O972_07370 [Mycobacterium avium subsp. avium 10-9275]|nr:hypothetical protein BBJ32_01800 [Mycobacterium avium]AYJ05826.1 hypothetical protein DBO90_14170 [Mycobacterium avium]ETB11600.1 hypothetical protein P863_08345 [Mycobacterium avium subsp. silvaticum ATCC 49884]ETB18480.1 hypothetical protein O972_07370 [Mycobacterium avium subsp. avium 10-9275]ETB22481.1 hypothetical protein O973_07095 [Mycobacterium avium subsp. avium 11-4751]
MTVGIADSLEGSDLVLLMLAAPTKVASAVNRVNGITRLEKLLFLVQQETDIPNVVSKDRLQFVAYDYGPFSKDVYQAVELLEEAELVIEERVVDGRTIDSMEDVDVTGAVEGDEYVERQFLLTEKGAAVARLLGRHHPDVVSALSAIKDQYAARPLSSLIRHVYRTYPDSAVNSKIAHRFR